MSEFIAQNITWVLSIIIAGAGVAYKAATNILESRIMMNVRKADHEIHERVDWVEDMAKENAILRREDKSRQDRVEKMVDEIRHDVKKLLKGGISDD